MSLPEVALELDKKTRLALRQGEVVDFRVSTGTVRWEDGATEEVRFGSHGDRLLIHSPAGGLRHRRLIDPQGARQLLETAPARAFALALLDSSRPMSSRDLITRMETDFSVDGSALWKAVREAFEADEHVSRSGHGPALRYTWTGEPEPFSASIEPKHQQDQSGGMAPAITAGPEPERARLTAAVTASAPTPPRSPSPAESPSDTGEVGDVADDIKASGAETNPALTLIYEVRNAGRLPQNWTDLLVEALRTPLSTGTAVEPVPEDVLRDVIGDLGRAALALLALPRNSKSVASIDAVGLAGPDAIAALIDTANSEARDSQTGSTRPGDTQRALEMLARRVLASPSVGTLGLDTVLRLSRTFGLQSEPSKDTELSTHAVWSVIDSMSSAAWRELQPSGKSAVARQLTQATLRPKSPRARVMTWLWQHDPAELAKKMWWRGVSFEDLSSVATTPLGSALESHDIAETLVRPVIVARLEGAATRQQLLPVLAAPTPLARLLDTDAVVLALERVMRSDDIARAWMVKLRNEASLDELQRKVDTLTLEVRAADELRAAARNAGRAAEERLRQTDARLAEAAASSQTLRASQARQIKIDTMRSLANLCAFVDGAVDRQPPERIRQRVRQLARREGIEPIGAVGDVEAYEPGRHDIVGHAPNPGAPVTLTGIGYAWDDGENSVVLVRALAERSKEVEVL